jgi:hypothetical protein
MIAGPITRKAVAKKAVSMRKMKKAARFGASAVATEQSRKLVPVVRQDFVDMSVHPKP